MLILNILRVHNYKKLNSLSLKGINFSYNSPDLHGILFTKNFSSKSTDSWSTFWSAVVCPNGYPKIDSWNSPESLVLWGKSLDECLTCCISAILEITILYNSFLFDYIQEMLLTSISVGSFLRVQPFSLQKILEGPTRSAPRLHLTYHKSKIMYYRKIIKQIKI